MHGRADFVVPYLPLFALLAELEFLFGATVGVLAVHPIYPHVLTTRIRVLLPYIELSLPVPLVTLGHGLA